MVTLRKCALVVFAWTFGAAPAITTTVRAEQTSQAVSPPLKEYRIVRSVSKHAQECIDCHADQNKGIVADWASSRHAHANISCLDCHSAGPADNDISKEHFQHDKTPVSVIVSPKDCSRCHPTEAAQYAKSKHANTLELIWKIDPWLNHGMNNDIERQTGCFHCHGSIVKVENGIFDSST
ncbi:MAG: multiheme c-type cytochrome, partial [Planctomycetota bacterium]